MARTGGQALIDALKIHGADHVFCVPGESYLAALDALYGAQDAIRLIVCRQEGGAANMAEAYGKLTGRPGICFVTRGPGATNASIGVHTAFQDSTPMILFIGQADQAMLDREAFQEVDFRAMFTPLAKWAAEIRDANRIPEYVARAFHTATSGRPGPVVLSLPEDVLSAICEAGDARPYVKTEPSPSAADMAGLRARLAKAERPFLVLGGPGWDRQAIEDARSFAERADLPVCTSFRAKDRFDNTHPNFCGDLGIGADPRLVGHIRDSDLLIVVGARLGEMTTAGYTRLAVPSPRQALVHVHPGADELNRVYQADLAILSGVGPFLREAASLAIQPHWQQWRAEARAACEDWAKPVAAPGGVNPSDIFAWLGNHLPPDAIMANGAGNYAAWLHRFYPYRGFPTLLGPTSGAMGYGVPAAVAAKVLHPDRMVIASAGDGCFLMNGQELATAVQYHAAVIFLVFDNGMYGTIRMHQEREYPGRTIGTGLANPDFVALARAYGALGFHVTRTVDFAQAFHEAEAAKRPALIHIHVDPEAISPTATLSGLRAARK
ncbi:MAG: thiamine pyrophosphate-binding protein [Alphaproteobacteria bacterium]|nr:thiamine pyrophosphate-binding protein [Alphaproteobacteria bacterium]